MSGKRKESAALIVDQAFKAALLIELGGLAHRIQARDKCTDAEAIERAMKEYDRIVREVHGRRTDLKDAQERKRREDALRADGQPTLKTSLGDMPGFAALRAKLAAPNPSVPGETFSQTAERIYKGARFEAGFVGMAEERCPFCERTDTHRGKPDETHHVFIRKGDPWPT